MALFTQNAQSSASGQKQRWFHRRVEESSERTLVSPLMLKRPAGRVIYWTVFALLLVSTLITFGPLYWMFSSVGQRLSASRQATERIPTLITFGPLYWMFSSALKSSGPKVI